MLFSKIDRNNTINGSLDQLTAGRVARVLGLSEDLPEFERQRLMDLGLVPNTLIQVVKDGIGSRLRAYSWRGSVVALRQNQASRVLIEEA